MVKNPTVFVFDDEISIKNSIREFLIEEGYNVIDAISYEQAVTKINEQFPKTPVNLAILDIKQTIGTKFLPRSVKPERVGFALAKKIQGLDNSIPIIFLTGFEDMQGEADNVQHFKFFTKGAGTPIGNPDLMRKTIVEAFEEQENIKDFNKDKICIKHRDGKNFIKYVISISDIQYFKGERSTTDIHVKGLKKTFTLAMNAVSFYSKLCNTIENQGISNTFFKVGNGKYANLDQVAAYDSSAIYFDYEVSDKNKLEINTAAAHLLNLRFPFVRTRRD